MLSTPKPNSPTSEGVSTRIIVGIDNLGSYRPVIALLERLRFPSPHLTLIHSARETLPFAPAFGDSREIEEQYAETATKLGNIALHESTALASSKGMSCDAHLAHGNAAEALMREADKAHADFIALNTNPAGVARTSYVGSIGRALAIASDKSVLFSKGDAGTSATLTAVFATDHSPFSARCLDRLIELAPRGIGKIVVVSAWEIDDRQSELLGKNVAMLGGDADRWIEEAVVERNAQVCRRFEAAGYQTQSVVRRGTPNEVIHHAMGESTAGLLIVGSQGSGAMAKAVVGSVSLHQALSEAYPVLIVRPREQ